MITLWLMMNRKISRKLLREMRADMLKGFQQTVEAFETVYEQITEVKEDVLPQ